MVYQTRVGRTKTFYEMSKTKGFKCCPSDRVCHCTFPILELRERNAVIRFDSHGKQSEIRSVR